MVTRANAEADFNPPRGPVHIVKPKSPPIQQGVDCVTEAALERRKLYAKKTLLFVKDVRESLNWA